MSNQPTQDKNTLAQVLGRINALSQKKTTAVLPVVVTPEVRKSQTAIPVLTEVYSGEIVHGYQVDDVIPVLPDNNTDAESLSSAELDSYGSSQKAQEQLIKRIMADMQPIIDSAVKEALIHELAVVEVRLLATLEKELNSVLRLRLETILKP